MKWNQKAERATYGFSIWVGAEGAPPLPDSFIDTIIAMTGPVEAEELEIPSYFRGPPPTYILTGSIMTDRAASELASMEMPLLPWTDKVPMVAVDGRMVQFMMTTWGEKIEAHLTEIEAMLGEGGPLAGILYAAFNNYISEYKFLINETSRLVDAANVAGVPIWQQVHALVGGASGMFMPTYVMMPATVIEAWALMYLDAGELQGAVQLSLMNGEPEELVLYYANEVTQTSQRGKVSGPMLVGIAALGMTAVGMYVAVRTGATGQKTHTGEVRREGSGQ